MAIDDQASPFEGNRNDFTAAREPLKPYKFSGKCRLSGFFLILVATIIWAGIVGVCYHYAALWHDWLLFSALIVGVFAGIPAISLAKPAHCRNLALLCAIGFVGGAAAYGARLVADSQALRPLMVRAYTRRLERDMGLSAPVAQARVERALNPWNTLKVMLDVESVHGVGISDESSTSYAVHSRSGSEDISGGTTTYAGREFWLFLAGEILLAGIGGLALCAGSGLKTGYCEQDRKWMTPTKLVRLAPGQAGSLVQAIQDRAWSAVAQAKPRGAINQQNYVQTTVCRCESCGSGTILVHVQAGKQGRTLSHLFLEPSDTEELYSRLSPQPTPVR